MGHLPHLITDLALILGAAAISTLIFKKLKQPLVLGYIIAGFLVGPHFHFIPTVADNESVETLAEIGVIFLLFSLGLEFSFKKLIRVGGSASITALVEIVFITVAGYYMGKWMGWSTMDSLFLGGMLASSSTTIILRAFDELGIKTKAFAGIVFGVLIVEDIVVILLMVLLSTLAVTRVFEGTEMLLTVLKLLFFLVLWFVGGIFILPSFLKKAKQLLTDEITLVLSLALCFGMVVLATAAGFSAELGAFVMGSIIAETTSAEKIEHLLKPVKDMFGAVFFTSVGMMIDPASMVEYARPIMYVTLLTLGGKLLSTTVGALLSGQPLKQSVQVGMSMAQIGEFAFIVATLGLSLGVTSAFLFPVAVGASAITTFTTPYMIKMSAALSRWLEKVLPRRVIRRLSKYSDETKKVSHTSQWKKYIRSTIINAALLIIIVVAIVIFSSNYIEPWIGRNGNSLPLKITVCLLTLILCSPFLWALAIKTPSDIVREMIDTQSNKSTFYIVRSIRLVLVAFIVGFLLHRFFNIYTGVIFTTIFLALLLIFSKKIQALYNRLENRFINNLNDRELETSRLNRTELAPWDAHIISLTVPSTSACIGKKLKELQWRETVGVNVVMIKRNDVHISAPGREEMIFPNDELLVLGTDHQVQRLKVLIRQEEANSTAAGNEVALFNYFIAPNNSLNGKTIRESGLREQANALVVGIERSNERILNPESTTMLQANDNLFIVANPKKIKDHLLQFERTK